MEKVLMVGHNIEDYPSQTNFIFILHITNKLYLYQYLAKRIQVYEYFVTWVYAMDSSLSYIKLIMTTMQGHTVI